MSEMEVDTIQPAQIDVVHTPAKHSPLSCDSDEDGTIHKSTSSNGSVRIIAAPPTSTTSNAAALAKQQAIEERKARLMRELEELKQQEAAEAAAAAQQEDVQMEADEPERAPITSAPATPSKHTQSQPSSPSSSPSPSHTSAAPAVDLTSDVQMVPAESSTSETTTPVTSATKPSKKRKSKEPTEAAATDGVDGAAAADSSAVVTPPAKKPKAASSAKKGETPEQKEARKAAEKAAKEAEKEAKRLEKEKEKLEAKEQHRLEMEKKKLEKQKEIEEKKEAHRREVEEKKAERQRELDAKKAEKDAVKYEKQKELDAKREAKLAEEKRIEQEKEAKKKSLEKSKGFMSSFFKLGSGTAGLTGSAKKESDPNAAAAGGSSEKTDSPAAAAAASTQTTLNLGGGATANTDASSSTVVAKPAMTEREKERQAIRTAVFLPYTPDRRTWTREHARLAQNLREQQAAEIVIDFECTGLLKDQFPDWSSDPVRIARAKQASEARRERLLKAQERGPVMTKKKKLLQFHENYRPAWYGRMRKTLLGEVPAKDANAPATTVTAAVPVAAAPSSSLTNPPRKYFATPRARRPFGRWSVDPAILNYDIDSEDEWGEEPEDAEELASESGEDDDSDMEGESGGKGAKSKRGDGYEEDEDGWLVPEDQDPLAGMGGEKKSDPRKGKGKVREAPMVPIIVGPIKDLPRLAKLYAEQQKQAKSDPTFQPTVQLTEGMKDLIMLRKRWIMPDHADPATYRWRIPAADILAATPPHMLAARAAATAASAKVEPMADVAPAAAVSIIAEVKQESADVKMEIESDVKPEFASATTTKEEDASANTVADTNGVAPMEC